MTTDQRPEGLPPFFHELTPEERQTLSCARFMQAQLHLVYRLRGKGRDADERDSREGWLLELNGWFSAVQALGDRVQREAASVERRAVPD